MLIVLRFPIHMLLSLNLSHLTFDDVKRCERDGKLSIYMLRWTRRHESFNGSLKKLNLNFTSREHFPDVCHYDVLSAYISQM